MNPLKYTLGLYCKTFYRPIERSSYRLLAIVFSTANHSHISRIFVGKFGIFFTASAQQSGV
jgi:hypothetical protein